MPWWRSGHLKVNTIVWATSLDPLGSRTCVILAFSPAPFAGCVPCLGRAFYFTRGGRGPEIRWAVAPMCDGRRLGPLPFLGGLPLGLILWRLAAGDVFGAVTARLSWFRLSRRASIFWPLRVAFSSVLAFPIASHTPAIRSGPRGFDDSTWSVREISIGDAYHRLDFERTNRLWRNDLEWFAILDINYLRCDKSYRKQFVSSITCYNTRLLVVYQHSFD